MILTVSEETLHPAEEALYQDTRAQRKKVAAQLARLKAH
jgi:hypothetical protein